MSSVRHIARPGRLWGDRKTADDEDVATRPPSSTERKAQWAMAYTGMKRSSERPSDAWKTQAASSR